MPRVIIATSFLYGQIELYKQRFVDTDNNRYIDSIKGCNDTLNLIIDMRKQMTQLWRENIELKKIYPCVGSSIICHSDFKKFREGELYLIEHGGNIWYVKNLDTKE